MKLVTLKEAIESGHPFNRDNGSLLGVKNGDLVFHKTGKAFFICNTHELTQAVWKIIREPRIWYVNTYKTLKPCIHETKEKADKGNSGRLECIKVQEVLEGEL